jgi:hypothetical protein
MNNSCIMEAQLKRALRPNPIGLVTTIREATRDYLRVLKLDCRIVNFDKSINQKTINQYNLELKDYDQ